MRNLTHFQDNLNKTFESNNAIATFGQPDRIIGSGLMIFEYDLDDGTKIRLGFPGMRGFEQQRQIIYAHHVQNDGSFVNLSI